jgi:N-acetylmuramoyl-L-alanine amidase
VRRLLAHVVWRVAACFGFAMVIARPAPAQQSPAQQNPAQQNSDFTVVLDASHGGAQTGTILGPQLYEKDVLLALSVHLRSALNARGIGVITTREGDTNPSLVTRAGEANHARAGACIVLHATASGSGVHLYTSSASPSMPGGSATGNDQNGLVPWSRAGVPFATQSLQLASDLGAAFTSAGLPYTLGRVHLAPLDAMNCPAVAVEVAPLRPSQIHNDSAGLADPGYQQRLVDAMAAALVEWRSDARSLRTNVPALPAQPGAPKSGSQTAGGGAW